MFPLWSRSVAAPIRNLSLAREPGLMLLRDGHDQLHLLDRKGDVLHTRPAPAPLVASHLADDGRAAALASQDGRVWLLAPDLAPLWQQTISRRPTALALDHLGRRLAVADENGEIHLFDTGGVVVARLTASRPLAYLAFVPEVASLIGSAEFGLVCAFDLQGKLLWRDGPVSYTGSLSVSGDGQRIILAAFGDGLAVYSLAGGPPRREAEGQVCRVASASYTGDKAVSADLQGKLTFRAGNEILGRGDVNGPVTGLALSALAERVIVGCADGRVVCLGCP